MLPMTSQVP